MKSGQILILVLLVVVVSLAVGLSVASRNITNLRTSTQTEQSQRAFTAAEGGIEQVLTELEDVVIAQGGKKDVQVGDITAAVGVVTNSEFNFTLNPGEVGQVNLFDPGSDYYSGEITIEWIDSNNTAETSTPGASLELTYVCESNNCFGESGNGNGYSQFREAIASEEPPGQSGIPLCSAVPGCVGGTDFAHAYTRTVNFGVDAGNNARILRIKPFWKQATVRVTGAVGLPVQSYEIESVASSEIGVTRRIKVTRSALEQLPAAFDYVLFSEGDIVK